MQSRAIKKSSSEAMPAGHTSSSFTNAYPEPVVRVEPNSDECKAKKSGFGDYVDCLVDPAKRCHFALGFGGGALCRHSARLQIALRTKPSAPVFVLNSNAA